MLSGFFYVAGGPAAAAAVWEMTRHWGSFRERVECDGNPWRFQEGIVGENWSSGCHWFFIRSLLWYVWTTLDEPG